MNLDKTRKIVSIVLMVLMIAGIVFNAFNLVGHCASDSNNPITTLPFPVGAGYGNNYSVSELSQILHVIEYDMQVANDPDYTTIGVVIAGEIDSTYSRFRVFSSSDCISVTNPLDAFTSGSVVSYKWGSSSYAGCREVILNTSDLSYYEGYWVTSYQPSFNSTSWLLESPTGSFYLSSGLLYGYPFYIFEDIYVNGTLFFSENPLTSSGGHSKGGDITQYTYDPADTPEPADPSAVSGAGGWLSKILDSLNKIKNSIVYGFQNLTGNLQTFFNQVFGGIEAQLNQIIDKLGGSELDTNDTSLSDNFMLAFQGSKVYGVVNTFTSGRDLVYGIFNAVENSTPQVLRFEFNMPYINLGGGHSTGGSSAVYPYGRTLVIDFSWYESVRGIVVPFILVWLYIGLLVWLLRAIPGFISGVPSFNTKSVSDSQPSIVSHYEVSTNGSIVRKFGRG